MLPKWGVFQSIKKAANRQNAKFKETKSLLLEEKVAKIFAFCRMWWKNACFARHFDLLHKPKVYRTHVRRRLRLACLDGFLDLCQSVKNKFLTD